jgi:streptogramin lyase
MRTSDPRGRGMAMPRRVLGRRARAARAWAAVLLVVQAVLWAMVVPAGTARAAFGDITEFWVPSANSRPIGIAAGPDGNLWFTLPQFNRIGRITPAGA